jgi:hypothetical protein
VIAAPEAKPSITQLVPHAAAQPRVAADEVVDDVMLFTDSDAVP